MTGPPAANVSPAVGEAEQSRAWAPCATFRSASFDALQLAAKGFYPFQLAFTSDLTTVGANLALGGAYNEMLDNSDIGLPRHALSQAMRYCDGGGLCLELDADVSGSGDDQITGIVTLLHDVYDGMRAPNAIPTNGDNFRLQPPAGGVACTSSTLGGDCLTVNTTPYGFDPTDDRVALPANSLDDVIFWGLGDVTGSFSTGDLSRGLGMTMLHHGVNWCDMCDVFIRHDPGNPRGTLQQQWQYCTQEPLSGYLPSPPEPDLRIKATDCTPCAANETSDANGVCVPCTGTVVLSFVLATAACTDSIEPCYDTKTGREYDIELLERWDDDSSYRRNTGSPYPYETGCGPDLDIWEGDRIRILVEGHEYHGAAACENAVFRPVAPEDHG